MYDENLILFYKETGIWPNGKDRSPQNYIRPDLELSDVKAKAYGLWKRLKELKKQKVRNK